jgi:ankyrin repeat protein
MGIFSRFFDGKINKLVEAINRGDANQVKELIERGVPVNALYKEKSKAHSDREPILYIATSKGDLKILEFLLDADANPNLKTDSGHTSLGLAVSQKCADVVKLLISNGADVNAQDENKDSALIVAAREGSLEIVKILLEAGANANLKNGEGETALYTVVRNHGDLKILELLLDTGADPNIKTALGMTSLSLAAARNYFDIVKLLISVRVDVNAQDKSQDTALIVAAREGNLEIVKILLEAGASVNLKNDKSETALDIAMRYDKNDIVQVLLANGAIVNQILKSRLDSIRKIQIDANYNDTYARNSWVQQIQQYLGANGLGFRNLSLADKGGNIQVYKGQFAGSYGATAVMQTVGEAFLRIQSGEVENNKVTISITPLKEFSNRDKIIGDIADFFCAKFNGVAI